MNTSPQTCIKKGRGLRRLSTPRKTNLPTVLKKACAILSEGRSRFIHPVERVSWTSTALADLMVSYGFSSASDDFFTRGKAFLDLVKANGWAPSLDKAEGSSYWTRTFTQ